MYLASSPLRVLYSVVCRRAESCCSVNSSLICADTLVTTHTHAHVCSSCVIAPIFCLRLSSPRPSPPGPRTTHNMPQHHRPRFHAAPPPSPPARPLAHRRARREPTLGRRPHRPCPYLRHRRLPRRRCRREQRRRERDLPLTPAGLLAQVAQHRRAAVVVVPDHGACEAVAERDAPGQGSGSGSVRARARARARVRVRVRVRVRARV